MERNEIAARLASLSPAKRALLERRRRGEAAATQVFAIGRRPDPGPAPLSFSQQRMWFLDQLEPGAPTYNLRVLLRLSGPLDRRALARSFQEVVRRHEILRTAFREEASVPVQIVLPHLPHLDEGLPLVDLSAVPAAAREAESLARLREIAAAGFDLYHPPLLRIALAELAPSDHHLLVVMHHIVSDGWSMGVLVREIGALYEAFATGRPSPLPELPVQYADFAVWQREHLTGEVLERDLGYWRERLHGAADLDLPTDRQRPAVQSSRGDAWRFGFDAGLMESIEALARREGATPFMVLAAGLLTMLARLSGQGDVSIGSPTAGRNRPEVEGLIGFFINTLVFRADVSGAGDFLALLHHVREITLGAYAHQDVPFEKLVAEIAPDRDMSRTPLFQVALAFQNAPLLDASLSGLEIHPAQLPVDSAKFDLAFIVGGESGALSASLEYTTDLFDRTSAARLAGQWQRLLAAATAAPDSALPALALLSPAERHQVLREWNDTRSEVSGIAGDTVLLHEAFERQVDLQPEALAAVWEEETLTYRELEGRANRLASFLSALGAGPGAPVGVWMERSTDMLAALLGTCKAGAAYLPIDAGWPAERAEAVLAGTQAGIVVTRRSHLAEVQGLQWRLPRLAHAVCLDVESPEPPPEPIELDGIQELWDVVSERAVDWITEAGFYSAYTGEPFSAEEVVEYRDRVVGLAEPWLGPDPREKRVLEIGCGSGLILFELAPRVGQYVGVDPSARTQERNRERAGRESRTNVELRTGFAHEIDALDIPAGSFDLVILASTVQFFPGLLYLEKVLDLALSRLAPGGGLIVADVLDPRRREDFRRSLAEFAAAHPGSAAARAAAGRNEARELFVDEAFFAELPRALSAAEGVRVLHREAGFPNELRFRYDVVVEKAAVPAAVRPAGRSRRVWTGWHVAQSPADRPQPLASPVDIAYVIHTSGSTGEPKGIVVQHRPAVALCRWVNDTFGVGPHDRLLFITSPAFDLSVYDVFGVLGAGGTVHVAPEGALRDPEELVRLLVEEPVTIWDSAPAALQQLAPLLPEPGTVEARLRLVLLSGDWIPVPLPDVVRASFSNARVISLGGATEATVWSNWFPIEEVDPRWPSIPYGRPIANARYHVLNRSLEPCPIGVPGDLYIGGECLCVGYARLPEMTAVGFIPDPFGNDHGEPGARLYATGDHARYGADGNLEFLGRVDQQVKIRGYRIELEEIEAVLSRHPGVREAAVVAREDIPGDKRLVGYVVPTAWPAPSSAELRAALQQVMPEYMVPWTFVALERMPLTANGKLDRKGLPAPQEMAPIETDYVAPETSTERAVAAIWHEVLGLPRVGLNDNFFELGGSSLVAAQVISRVRQVFAVELPLRALFENRTLVSLAQRIAELKAEAAVSAIPPLVPASRDELLPLSFAQQGLWMVDQVEPGSPRYNIPGAMHIAGRFQPELLRSALDAVVRRHEVLRTTFHDFWGGEPAQLIAPAEPFPLPVVDLSGLPSPCKEDEAALRMVAEARRPFDLQAGPLLRSTLLRLDGEEHVALVTFHHIVSDAWSVGIFFREIAALFKAWTAAEPAALPELPVQYADFAVWQRSWLTGEVLDRELEYWRRQLAGMPRVFELPTDRPRPVVQSFRGRSRPLALPPGIVAPLESLGRHKGTTLFMVLLGAFAVVLGRATGQEDFGIGTAIDGRDRHETENLIGFFINSLVLRADLSGDPTFDLLLDRIRGMALGAYAHQSLPFERLVEDLVPVRDPSHAPLFQVAITLQNTPAALALPGLTLAQVPVDSGSAKMDMILLPSESDGVLSGICEYSTALFDVSTVDRLLGHLGNLLRAVVAEPGRRISELPLLSPAEQHQLSIEWNDTQVDFPRRPFVHEMVAEHARRDPEAPAVADGPRRLTYGELDAQAEALAARLRAAGVGPEVAVALWTERSLEMIVGILAVVKAGGAYLPLDPSHPVDRLTFMISDSAAPVLLTQQRMAAAASQEGLRGVRVLLIDDPVAAVPAVPAAVEITAETPAYLIYTSGSTGRPKGVQVAHGSLANMVRWHHAWSGLAPGQRATQVAAPAFDATVFEIWPCLTAGACLHIIDDATRLAPPKLIEWLTSEKITVTYLPTPLAEALLDQPWPAEIALRELHTAGDRLHHRPRPDHPFALFNLYGPTEVTVLASGRHVPPADSDAGSISEDGPPPIGRPISNARIHLLDRNLQPVAIGVPGEIVIGGAGLARGYLGRPDLTAERFVPDPFAPLWGEGGARLYRTGDLASWLPDGELDFVGRADHQVKIRGFRIELGEIEAELREHPAVQVSVVVAREDAPGEKALVAYLVPRDGQTPEVRELRQFLAAKLPPYMVPATFVTLAALPLSANGKVDRAALTAPPRKERAFVAPRTPDETILCQIWAEVLSHDEVGIEDNFFDLGGDSILGIQVVSRSQQAGLAFTTQDLFQYQTVAELALVAVPEAPAEEVVVAAVVPASGEAVVLTPEAFPEAQFSQKDFNSLMAQIGKKKPLGGGGSKGHQG
jgi:amino acid adenylation domain-containing protein